MLEPARGESRRGPVQDVAFRKARPADASAVFELRRRSIAILAATHHSPQQIAAWIGRRTPTFHAELIARGNTVVAVRHGTVLGFVEAECGEVARLFILPEAAGLGLGRSLLLIGIELAKVGHDGPVRLEATVNAEGFYHRHGFRVVRRAFSAQSPDCDPIEVVHMELAQPTAS